ncbi:MAG: type restriction enzyme subunit, partial [Verrucomicrobiota bacterium]
MNEAETRAEHIDPAMKAAGWGVVEGSRIRREYLIAPGRIEGHGRRGKPLCAAMFVQALTGLRVSGGMLHCPQALCRKLCLSRLWTVDLGLEMLHPCCGHVAPFVAPKTPLLVNVYAVCSTVAPWRHPGHGFASIAPSLAPQSHRLRKNRTKSPMIAPHRTKSFFRVLRTLRDPGGHRVIKGIQSNSSLFKGNQGK